MSNLALFSCPIHRPSMTRRTARLPLKSPAVKPNKRPNGRSFYLAFRRRQRSLGELRHTVFEAIEERVVGRAREPALVRALEKDGGLPERERRVPANVAH